MAAPAGSDAPDAFKLCLEGNKRWARSANEKHPELLARLAKGQSPQILWLGCSDSRTPETTVLDLRPGDVFTHRNIANIFNPTDLSLLSVVEYAVRYLKVAHVVVCGHTSCGGVNAALGNAPLPVLDLWLQPMRKLRERHAEMLGKLEGTERSTALAKLNVLDGVENMKRVPVIIQAVKERGLQVHGILYDVGTGLVEELDCPEDEETACRRIAAWEAAIE